MPIHIITIPVCDPTPGEGDYNAFVRSHRVVAVERRFVEQGTSSYWTFCIDYLEPGANGSMPARGQGNRGKVDYKEVLTPEEFAVFAKLRDLRKELAQAEGVPMYAIFTNEQLAKMVQARVQSRADLEKIDGVGEARVKKHGESCTDVANSLGLSVNAVRQARFRVVRRLREELNGLV